MYTSASRGASGNAWLRDLSFFVSIGYCVTLRLYAVFKT